MKRARKPKKQKVTMTQKDIDNIRRGTLEKFWILMLLAVHDELGVTDDQLAAIYKRAERYTGYIENKIVELDEVKKIIEDNLNVTVKGWGDE